MFNQQNMIGQQSGLMGMQHQQQIQQQQIAAQQAQAQAQVQKRPSIGSGKFF
jgi:hypothetical protein